jgi:4-hydroxy-4-methyl-2-oxoglutarate aldolase
VGHPGGVKLSALPTAAVADACVRLKVPERAVSLRPAFPAPAIAGRVLPVRHAGSVDVFFEALQAATPGDVLVIDNEGRLDEGCIGDLTCLEALHHGAAGIVVDGCHRDSAALRSLGIPVWSRGAFPFGPRAARPRSQDALSMARVGPFFVTRDDVVAADEDGAVFVPHAEAPRVWDLAARIQRTESDQARRAQAGEPLCGQFQFPGYLAKRKADPQYGFRAHLRSLGKSIEE